MPNGINYREGYIYICVSYKSECLTLNIKRRENKKASVPLGRSCGYEMRICFQRNACSHHPFRVGTPQREPGTILRNCRRGVNDGEDYFEQITNKGFYSLSIIEIGILFSYFRSNLD